MVFWFILRVEECGIRTRYDAYGVALVPLLLMRTISAVVLDLSCAFLLWFSSGNGCVFYLTVS